MAIPDESRAGRASPARAHEEMESIVCDHDLRYAGFRQVDPGGDPC
jgi:hypothetical protein